jgi:F-box domain
VNHFWWSVPSHCLKSCWCLLARSIGHFLVLVLHCTTVFVHRTTKTSRGFRAITKQCVLVATGILHTIRQQNDNLIYNRVFISIPRTQLLHSLYPSPSHTLLRKKTGIISIVMTTREELWIPDALWNHVLSFFGPSDLCGVALVNRTFRDWANQDCFWEIHCLWCWKGKQGVSWLRL